MLKEYTYLCNLGLCFLQLQYVLSIIHHMIFLYAGRHTEILKRILIYNLLVIKRCSSLV